MGIDFTPGESRALYSMLAARPEDIVLKTDRDGFILHASAAISQLGFPFDAALIGPHLLDLAGASHKAEVDRELQAAIAGRPSGRWIEFAAPRAGWFELQLTGLAHAGGEVYGALGIMRSIAERKRLEERLFASELTDPLTGLTNRRAFIAMLQYLVDQRIGGCLALFDIDYFRTINMRFGQRMGDRVLVVFSDLLRAMMRHNDIISRIGDECLAVLLPEADPCLAGQVCGRIVETLAGIEAETATRNLSVTASAGIAMIGTDLDETIKRAELALILAKAKGRNRLEVDAWPRYRALRSA
jgi:diguanylate cyclase (GGDEF)-like protein/PAS domain S-box-containing protein